MCGITGILRAGGLSGADEGALGGMIASLDHRGPDGRGQHVDRAAGLALGHTRLSIIDLSQAGAQPLFDGDNALVANGEFYEYKTHRARLLCQGEQFASKSDSEIALKLYRRYGLDFVEHLRGEFAFALYDAAKKRLILVRDRFGIRPLFFHRTERALIFGSELKAILAHPGAPRRLDRRAALHQMMQTLPPGMSVFEGISALEPGTMLIVDVRGDRLDFETRRYWDLDFPDAAEHDPNPNPEEYVQAVRDKLIDAVRVRLEADVPVGCYLSGGIDSCSILGLSTAMQQSPVKAFTIAFDDDSYDESALAAEMAQRTQADQDVMRVAADELYGDHFLQTAWHTERTFYNTLSVAKWHMSRRVRECGFKVVVTGEGSDELFGGYPFFKRDYFLHATADEPGVRELGAKLEQQNALFRGSILSEKSASHLAMEELCGFTPSWLQPWILTLAAARPLLSDDVLAELGDYDPIAAIAERIDRSRVAGRHPLDKVQYTWCKTMLEGQILSWGGDRVDMANSMESRPAFLDHYLAEFATRIPPGVRIRNGIEKWVLREAMREVLPEQLYKKEKFAFMAPPSYRAAKKMKATQALIDRVLDRDVIARAGLFDADRVAAFLARSWKTEDPAEATRNDILINHLLGIHIVHLGLVEGQPPPLSPVKFASAA